MPLQTLTESRARAVYSILVDEAGASKDPHNEDSFVLEFSKARPGNEWRFCGSLGFGGKFRFPRMTVDFYPEDDTAERRAAVERTNLRLAALRDTWLAVGLSAA